MAQKAEEKIKTLKTQNTKILCNTAKKILTDKFT